MSKGDTSNLIVSPLLTRGLVQLIRLRENRPMTIFINGEARELGGVSTLADLLDALDLPKQRVAIELNKHVIRKQDWDSTPVADNDKVEVVHFVGGG